MPFQEANAMRTMVPLDRFRQPLDDDLAIEAIPIANDILRHLLPLGGAFRNVDVANRLGGFEERSSLICATTVCTVCEHAPPKGRKTRHIRLWHRHPTIRRAGGLFGGCLRTSWNRTRVRDASQVSRHTVAIFRQINKGALHANYDALEFPDGNIVLLTRLYEGQKATVLTLPTQPKTAAEVEAQQRVAHIG